MKTGEKKYVCALRTLCGCEKIFQTNAEPGDFLDIPIVESMQDVLERKKSTRLFKLVHIEDGHIFFYRETITPRGAR